MSERDIYRDAPLNVVQFTRIDLVQLFCYIAE